MTGANHNITRAREAYQEALTLVEAINLPRFSEESWLGLILIAGLQGDLKQAELYATQAINLLQEAGDAYWAWVCHLSWGAAAVMCGHTIAPAILTQAIPQGEIIGDSYGLCLGYLWLALYYLRGGQTQQAIAPLQQALKLAKLNDYQAVFTRITFLGPKDPSWLAALLKILPAHHPLNPYVATLKPALQETINNSVGMNWRLDAKTSAPLYIQTLGPFRVWRHGLEIPATAWRREKALRLFQLLVTHRHTRTLLHREQILDIMWPDTSPDLAANGLRVVLSALRQTLNPDHTPKGKFAFLKRERDLLGLEMSAGILVDADEFTRKAGKAPGL